MHYVISLHLILQLFKVCHFNFSCLVQLITATMPDDSNQTPMPQLSQQMSNARETKFVDNDSTSPTQGATQFVDCLVWIQGEAKQGKWSWVRNGPKKMPNVLPLSPTACFQNEKTMFSPPRPKSHHIPTHSSAQQCTTTLLTANTTPYQPELPMLPLKGACSMAACMRTQGRTYVCSRPYKMCPPLV